MLEIREDRGSLIVTNGHCPFICYDLKGVPFCDKS